MKTINLQSATQYYSLYSLANLPVGTSLIVTNNTNTPIRIIQSENEPIDELDGFPIWPNDTALVHGNDMMEAWVKGKPSGYIIIQPLTSTVIPLSAVELPQDIVTSGKEGFRRLQVDQGQTGFFEAREFRVKRKIRLAAGQSIVYKNILNVDIIIQLFAFTITDGNYEVHVWTDDNVSETSPFTIPVPFFPKNGSSEFREYNGDRYQSQMQIFTGGSIDVTDTDQYIDYLEMKTSNSTAHAAGVSGESRSARYTPSPITFYTQITNIGSNDCRGTIANEWEERPPGVK